MSLEDLYALSYYQKVADIDRLKNVCLVQHTQNHRFYVQKTLEIFNVEVYRWLQQSDCCYFPKVYECVETENELSVPCLTVIEEYIPGENYEDIFREQGPLSEMEIVELGIELCRALSTIHALNPPIIHRDIKPSNMIRQRDGQLCLIDFNAARIYTPFKQMDTIVMGTDGFAAPEQYGYGQCGVQTDIYGIGASMNYLLTGMTARERLYTGAQFSAWPQTQSQLQHQSQLQDQLQYQLQKQLSDIIQKATAFEPSARYQNVQEMMADLEKCLILLRKDVYDTTYKNTSQAAEFQSVPAANSSDRAERDSAAVFSAASPPVHPLSWQNYLPPGFRKFNSVHMILSIFGYLSIFSIGSGISVTGENGTPVTGAQLWMNRICATALMLHEIFFLCNYLDMRKNAPFMKRIGKKYLRLLLTAGYAVLIAFFWIFTIVFLEVLFFS